MRRFGVSAGILLILSLMVGFASPARAQQATPVGGGLTGYPKLAVTITNDGIEAASTSVPAGWVILSVTNQSQDQTNVTVVAPASGMTIDELIQRAATPEPNDEFPAIAYDITFTGGPNGVMPGETEEAIIHLSAGDWAIAPEKNGAPIKFTAADGPDSVTIEPTADATIELGDFYFGGLDEGLPAGHSLVKIANVGQQPHMLDLAKGPETMTLDQVMAAFLGSEGGTPAPGGLTEDQLAFVPGVTVISAGQTIYLPMNLNPGTYLALCFVPDKATGAPHALEGMAATFKVS